MRDRPSPHPVLETRHLMAAGRRVPVELSQNECGSIAARFVLGANDTPIVDAPDREAALELLQSALEALALTRAWKEG